MYCVGKQQNSLQFKPNDTHSTQFRMDDVAKVSSRHTHFFVLFFTDIREAKN